MNKKAKQRIDVMIAAGVNPARLKGSEAQGLKLGRSTIKLIGNDGQATQAGKYWTIASGQPLPVGGFMQQDAVREGNVETIKLADGRKGVTRKWDEATGVYKFTKLGNDYYKLLRRNYVAAVPVIIDGKRKNGSTYKVKSHMPVEKLGLKPKSIPLNMGSPQRRARVKQMIEEELPDEALYEVSDESWTLDPDGSWKISEETVGTNPDTGNGESHVVLDRRVGARPVFTQFLFAEALCDEAFEEHPDKLCCPRQIASILKLDLSEVCRDLLTVERALYQTENWEEVGCIPKMVLEYARMNGLGCCILHNEQVVDTLPGNPILAFTVHEGHSYFYKTTRIRQALMARRTGEITHLKKAQRSASTPITSEWKPWADEIEAGHFFVDENDMATVRAWFLDRKKHPKVMMKDELRPRGLLYNLTKRVDGQVGTCVIHSIPENAGEIIEWLKRLDIGLEYRGEGLPNVALKVLQRLVKGNREREWLTGERKAELLEEYDFKCAMCDSRSSSMEWDHICRLSESFGEQEFQPLCLFLTHISEPTRLRRISNDVFCLNKKIRLVVEAPQT